MRRQAYSPELDADQNKVSDLWPRVGFWVARRAAPSAPAREISTSDLGRRGADRADRMDQRCFV